MRIKKSDMKGKRHNIGIKERELYTMKRNPDNISENTPPPYTQKTTNKSKQTKQRKQIKNKKNPLTIRFFFSPARKELWHRPLVQFININPQASRPQEGDRFKSPDSTLISNCINAPKKPAMPDALDPRESTHVACLI